MPVSDFIRYCAVRFAANMSVEAAKQLSLNLVAGNWNRWKLLLFASVSMQVLVK